VAALLSRPPLNASIVRQTERVMGRVLCQTHGLQGGPLCCEHVVDGANGKTSADPGGLVLLHVDLFGEHSEMLGVILCKPCATAFHRGDGDVLPDSALGDEQRLPSVVPACELCLQRWTGRTPSRRSAG
jgi:hypothetical protein